MTTKTRRRGWGRGARELTSSCGKLEFPSDNPNPITLQHQSITSPRLLTKRRRIAAWLRTALVGDENSVRSLPDNHPRRKPTRAPLKFLELPDLDDGRAAP
jgi:hypothetical protein